MITSIEGRLELIKDDNQSITFFHDKKWAQTSRNVHSLIFLHVCSSILERRYEDERTRTAEALAQLRSAEARLCEQRETLRVTSERDAREIASLRKYNTQLETQFNSQMEIITELKKRYLDLCGKVSV